MVVKCAFPVTGSIDVSLRPEVRFRPKYFDAVAESGTSEDINIYCWGQNQEVYFEV